jgi:heptosyltransferase-2
LNSEGTRSEPGVPEKILVVQTAFLGDLILTLPLIQAVRDAMPAAQIWPLVIPETAEILTGHPAVTGCFVYDKRGREGGFSAFGRMVGRVRDGRFALALIPHRSLRSALLAFLAGVPRRVGFWSSAGFFLFTRQVPRRRDAHEVERNLDLWQALGFRPESQRPRVYPREEDRHRARDFLARQGSLGAEMLVGVAPGSVWPTKRWLPEGFAQVIRSLRERRGAQTILFGSPADREICLQIAQQAGGDIPIAAGELSLLPAAALMERCRLVLSNDSAAAHLAAAVDRPVVTIFGPTVPDFGFVPFGEEHLVVQRPMDCRPCGIHGGHRCPRKTFACMKEITAEEVMDAVFAVLDKGEGSGG